MLIFKDRKDNNKIRWVLVFSFLLFSFCLIEPSPLSSACYQDPNAKKYGCYTYGPGTFVCLSKYLSCSTATCTKDSGCSYESCMKGCPTIGPGGSVSVGSCLEDASGGCLCDANKCNESCTPPTCDSVGWRSTVPEGRSCSENFHCYGVSECLRGNLICGTRTCYKSYECSCNQGCDSGYYDAYTGPRCAGPNTCSCSSECGTQTYPKKVCYRPETNTKPPSPEKIELIVDRRDDPNSSDPNAYVWVNSGNLSTDSSKPTRVKFPIISPTRTRVPTISLPSGARDIRYLIGGVVGVTSTDSSSHRYSDNYPTSLSEGEIGSVTAKHSTLNECDNNWKESDERKGYYKVDILPNIVGLTRYGNDTTSAGCTAIDFTGKEANNPLTIEITGTDADGVNDINGVVLWLVKDGSSIAGYLDKSYWMGGDKTTSDINRIGIFVSKTSIYKANNPGGTLHGWGRDVDGEHPQGTTEIYVDDNGQRKVVIDSITRVFHGIDPEDSNRYKVILELKFPTDSLLTGKYNFYAGMTDIFSHRGPSNKPYLFIDLKNIKTETPWYWNFDFVNPTIGSFTSTINDQRQATVSWQSNDTESGVKDTVVNVYNSIPDRAVKRIDPLPEAAITVLGTPTSSLIGKIDPLSSGWYYNSPINSTKIDIHENDSGLLQFYITAYDQACNYITSDATSTPSFDLNRWISTKGGVLFSQGRIGYIPKDIAGQEYNLGTELITTTHTHHPSTLSMSESFKNPTSVINVTDGNTLEPNRFDLLKLKLDRYKLGFKSITSLDQCGNKEVCIWESKESINIGSTNQTGGPVTITTYQGKILVVSEQDITVRPPIITIPSIEIKPGIEGKNPETSGLILFARGNIVINSESRTTGGTVEYDQIEAFMIARGQIQISAESSSLQDGVMVSGSLISFASNDNNRGILLQRDLGLLNVTNPVLVVTYHPKYAKISEIFFGKDNSAYKQEVGFKIW